MCKWDISSDIQCWWKSQFSIHSSQLTQLHKKIKWLQSQTHSSFTYTMIKSPVMITAFTKNNYLSNTISKVDGGARARSAPAALPWCPAPPLKVYLSTYIALASACSPVFKFALPPPFWSVRVGEVSLSAETQRLYPVSKIITHKVTVWRFRFSFFIKKSHM